MATIKFATTFLLNQTPKAFSFEDTTTDYSNPDNNGCFKITSPSGVVIYNNTDFSDSGCDIQNANSEFSQQVINLPLAILTGLPELGVYEIVYTVYNSDDETYYTPVTNTYTNSYVRPVICIQQTVDCVSPLFTSKDITNYVVNGIAPSISEKHNLYYPNGSAGQDSPIEATDLIITTGTFYQGVQTTEIQSDLFYTFPDGLMILDSIKGTKNITVNCVDICGLRCCINDLEARMIKEKCENLDAYKETRAIFSQVMGLVALIQLNTDCGFGDKVSCFINEIKALTHCKDGCGDCGSPGAPVIGLGTILNNVVVESGGSPVEVTANTSGSLTTYYVKLSAEFVTLVNSRYNTIVAAGSNVSVTDSGIIAGVRTFIVNADGSNSPHLTYSYRGYDNDAFTIDLTTGNYDYVQVDFSVKIKSLILPVAGKTSLRHFALVAKLSDVTAFDFSGFSALTLLEVGDVLTKISVSGLASSSIETLLLDKLANTGVLDFSGSASMKDAEITNCASITTIAANLCPAMTDADFNTSAALNYINIAGDTLLNTLIANGCALLVGGTGGVDDILLQLDTMAGINGTVDLSGGTSAAPTGGGSNANILSLIGKGWTVNTN